MILNNEFVVEAPLARVWSLMDEVERVITCLPGASYVGRSGEDHQVGMKVKVGAIVANFQGVVRFIERDATQHTATMRGTGKDITGKANANATIEVKLQAETAAATRVRVATDLAMTGRLAQFGGGIMDDIASRMVEQFAQNLHAMLLAQAPPLEQRIPGAAPLAAPASVTAAKASDAPAAVESTGRAREVQPFDLGGLLARRGLKFGALALGLVALAWLVVRS